MTEETALNFTITRLAALGRSPYQIEVELGFPPYTIHQKYHAALQEGYARRSRLQDSKSKELTTAPAEPIERQEKKKNEEDEISRRTREKSPNLGANTTRRIKKNSQSICANTTRANVRKNNQAVYMAANFLPIEQE